MEDIVDPYEEQLLAVFRSCDVNGNGVLNRVAFGMLCDTLQLEENYRNLLTARLCGNGKCNVEFPQFRDALLAVLASLKSPTDDNDEKKITDDVDTGQETTSKLVFGRKKYGRKSRPGSTEQEDVFDEDVSSTNVTNEDVFLCDGAFSTDLRTKSESEEKVSNIENRMSNDDNDFEIEALCKHLGVHENMIITNRELITICSSLGISNSVYDMIQESITELKSHNMSKDAIEETVITYGQFFQLIKNLGCVKDSTSIRISATDSNKTVPFNEDGISSVDINTSGSVSYDTLVYLLENAGINDAAIFLNDLGISPQFDVNLSELAGQLQEELLNVQRCMDESSNQIYSLHNPHLLLLQASVIVSQAQIKWYRSCVEQMQCERDKLRNDLSVANERANLLAQEVDDNHARMEKSVQQKLKSLEQKHTDQIKKLTQQWSVEREQLTNQNLKMERKLEQLLHDETKLRSDVASLKQDYENIEKENRNLLDQLVNAESVRDELEQEIQRLSLLKKKVLELESSNEQAISLLEKMNQLQDENILLRDKNDELAVALENVTLRQMQSRSGCSKRRGKSPLGGEENADTNVVAISTHRMFPKVRKYSTENELSTGIDGAYSESLNSALMTHYESGIEADISTSSSSLDKIGEAFAEANERVIVELKSRVAFLENFIRKCQLKVPYTNDDVNLGDRIFERSTNDLEKQCETLQQRLDQVQNEILKILSEKRACTEENCALKTRISELVKRVPNSDIADADQNVVTSTNSSSDAVDGEQSFDGEKFDHMSLNESCASRTDADNGSKRNAMTNEDGSCTSKKLAVVPKEENEMDWKSIGDEQQPRDSTTNDEGKNPKCAQNYDKLLRDYNRLAEENKTLSNKCEELNGCLSMLRSEYDQCEEYWISKLEDERKLYEEEQKISDENFVELQFKIQEYSEMLNTDSTKTQKISKLPPIDENDKLEKEVNDLQEEFNVFKEKMESENREKQNEIDRLMQIISLYETSGLTEEPKQDGELSLESNRSDKANAFDDIPPKPQNIPCGHKMTEKCRDIKLTELKIRRKQLKKECDKLECEKNALMENLIKTRSESTGYNFNPCTHVLQQHNIEVSKKGILLRLKHQEAKNRHLRNILLQHQKKLNKTMQEMLQQHEKELAKYRSALTSSQEMWQSLQETTKKQAEQIAMSDVLVKELYCENSQLMATIHQLEQQHLDYPPVLL